MKTAFLKTLLTVAALTFSSLLGGCGSGVSLNQAAAESTQAETGKIAVQLQWGTAKSLEKTMAALPATVTTVRILITAADITPAMQLDFPASYGAGTIEGVKAGTGRTLTAQGLDGSGTIIYQGSVSSITVHAGQTTEIGTITMIANAAPVANAGSSQSVTVGSMVTLDGSASSDANSDTLTYRWAFAAKPAGSSAALSSSTAVKPSFTPDVAGTYTLSLSVSDGKVNSSSATVTITAAVANAAPVANAGTAQSVVIGNSVTLDGSASSDANGDTLTYSWSCSAKPVGSNAALSSTTAVKPTFTPDVAGAYILSLVVNDGKVSSSAASVNVTAISNTGSITIRW